MTVVYRYINDFTRLSLIDLCLLSTLNGVRTKVTATFDFKILQPLQKKLKNSTAIFGVAVEFLRRYFRVAVELLRWLPSVAVEFLKLLI